MLESGAAPAAVVEACYGQQARKGCSRMLRGKGGGGQNKSRCWRGGRRASAVNRTGSRGRAVVGRGYDCPGGLLGLIWCGYTVLARCVGVGALELVGWWCPSPPPSQGLAG